MYHYTKTIAQLLRKGRQPEGTSYKQIPYDHLSTQPYAFSKEAYGVDNQIGHYFF